MSLAGLQAMSDDWNELRLVLAVVRANGLIGAARALGIDHSTVFRRLHAVEARLGQPLFERLPGGAYEPTAVARRMAAAAERMEDEALALARDIAGRDHRLTGRLRVTSSETLAHRILTPHLAAFRRAHPGIAVELTVDNRVLSLTRLEAHGVLASPVDLKAHPLIGWEASTTGIKAAEWLNGIAPDPAFVYRTSSLVNQLHAAKAGIGLAVLPCYLGDLEPELARALPDPVPELARELWIVTHSDLRRTARVRAFFDVVGAGLAAERALFEGRKPAVDCLEPGDTANHSTYTTTS